MTAVNPTSKPAKPRAWLPRALCGAGVVGLLVLYPPFHVVPLDGKRSTANQGTSSTAPAVFDPRAFAAQFWERDLPAAASRATDAAELNTALDRDPHAAADRYARRVGLGGVAYYFVAGEGRVVSVEKNVLRIAVGTTDRPAFAIDTGPVFGNALRDGTGVLDMNTFPGSAEFNALSAELNQLVEARVLPLLRGKAVVGARVRFAGCAEITGLDGDPRPLQLVPFQVEVR